MHPSSSSRSYTGQVARSPCGPARVNGDAPAMVAPAEPGGSVRTHQSNLAALAREADQRDSDTAIRAARCVQRMRYSAAQCLILGLPGGAAYASRCASEHEAEVISLANAIVGRCALADSIALGEAAP
jgi:hypothetical protein